MQTKTNLKVKKEPQNDLESLRKKNEKQMTKPPKYPKNPNQTQSNNNILFTKPT